MFPIPPSFKKSGKGRLQSTAQQVAALLMKNEQLRISASTAK